MGALFIKTADFKLAYRLMKALRKRGIDFVQISEEGALPNDSTVWLGTPEEVEMSNVGIGVACSISEVDLSIEKALHLSTQKNPTGILAFGVDPGPRPGLAWNSDGKPIGAQQMEGVDETVDRICNLISSIQHQISVIRIGDGAPTIGARIANICLARGLIVEMVDERRTSSGVGRHEHHAAAARIARMSGERILTKRKIQPTSGEIREVQRRSRSESGGRLTLPIELAQAVAVGRLSMIEALEEYDRRRDTIV